LDKRPIFEETKGESKCEFCGGSVTLKKWTFVDEHGENLVKDEQGRIQCSLPKFFLFVCEGCGRGSALESDIVRMVEATARGEIRFDAEKDDFVGI
jgi:hypothetical protein